MRCSIVSLLLLAARIGFADDMLATTPRAQAMRLYTQATKMFEDQDFVAAAVTFGQAQALLARVDRDSSGAIIDKEAHSFRSAALSNKATAYSRAGLNVEASNAFSELREQLGSELSPAERQEIDDAIARIAERIGTVVLRGLPDDDVAVRIDGRLEHRDIRKPLRISEGDHSLDIIAKGYKPFVAELTVTGRQEVVEAVALEPLKTPARLRIEADVGGSLVSVDGVSRGEAPAEVSVEPGRHHVIVASESFVTQTTEVELKPGERTIVRVGLVHAHAPLGLRLAPSYIASFPLRTDTPLGSYNNAIALGMYHDAFRIRTLRFGIAVDYHPRTLNSASVGLIATVCPDQFLFAGGKLAWCPGTLVASYVFGGSESLYASGQARGRGVTSVELRHRSGFVRLAVGLVLEDYARKPTIVTGGSYLMLWSAVAELAAGLDL